MALAAVPAPLLPPARLAGAVRSLTGLGWSPAYLVATVGLHLALYGSLGALAAFAFGPGDTQGRRWLRLAILPATLAGLALLVRSVKLGHVPTPGNALIPMAACGVGVAVALLFRQHGWRVALAATLAVSAGLAWASWPAASSSLSRDTQARLLRLLAAAPGLPSGDARFGALLQAAFAPPPSAPAGLDAVAHARAAVVALGIAIGHERLARYVGLERESELLRAAMALRAGTTLRGRPDWARHHLASAALAVLEGPFLSDAAGLIKEEVDALTRGSGFSFGDLAADRAGIRFARAATGSEPAARAMVARLQGGFVVDDFFPRIDDLPEHLSVERFRREYGGVGSARYRRAVAEIDARLDRCAALATP